jgi:nitrogenase molybdenum-iron protein alpha chain
VHEFTGSSASDLARVSQCKLVIGFTPRLDVPSDFMPGSSAQFLRRWFGMPLVWTCFNGPAATDISLRRIATHFDATIQKRTERVIAANRKKVDAVIAHYRPRLQDKLLVHFQGEPEAYLECYRLLGFRIGNWKGWPGKTGIWRTPHLVYDPHKPSDRALHSYIAEAKPDFILCDRHDVFELRKRGQTTMSFSPFFDELGNTSWGYDGFACLATTLDRAINTPWRKLVKPPWPIKSG